MDDIAARRDQLLAAALPHVAFDGWTVKTLNQAAADCGLDAADALRACPRGVIDLLDHWVAVSDRAMLDELANRDLAALKIRERVALAIRLRLEPLFGQREAVRRALALQALPQHAPGALRQLYRTVSAIWYAVGDTATDWNHYSKRALLAGVYSAVLLYWLNDKSEGATATWDFLDRRLADTMKLQKLSGGAQRLVDRLPDPFRLLRRVQAGR
jgi:ubiquinone biosynthesis protein COQ9